MGIAFVRVLAAVLLVAGCGEETPTDSTSKPANTNPTCDPLASTALPVTVGRIAGVGKDAAGNLYLVDQVERVGVRLFVSRATTLARRRVSGSGEIGSGPGSQILVLSEDDAGPFNLQIDVGATAPARMGLLRGPLPGSKTFEIGTDGEALQVLPSEVPADYHLENLPGTFSVGYQGSVPDGRVVLVIGPDVDARLEDDRVFFGTADRLVERPMVRVSVGSYSTIEFTIDGQPATAVFGSPLNTAVTSTLTIGAQSQPLTVPDRPALPPGARFFCLR
jgi:hypothetical protein